MTVDIATETETETETQPNPDATARDRQAEGPTIDALGSTWTLAAVGLARSLTRARDAIYIDLVLSNEVTTGDILETAYTLIRANYNLTPGQTMLVIKGTDFQELADAVIESLALFVYEMPEEAQSYTQWARTALLANSIDPTKLDRRDMQGILRQLVATGRAMEMNDFTAAGKFERARGELLGTNG